MKVDVVVPGSTVPRGPYGLCGRTAALNCAGIGSELRSCVKVEVAVLGFPSLISLAVSVGRKKSTVNDSAAGFNPGRQPHGESHILT